MVKLYALNVLCKSEVAAHWLKSSYDVSSFSFFQRNSVQEFMGFVSKTLVERTQLAARQSVKEGEYMCHVYVQANGLAGVVISDHEYPTRVAHTLITKVLAEFSSKVPASDWNKDETLINFNQLPVLLAKYQNPKEADALTKMQDDLDETKIILHNTITAVLERGEKLDDLVAKSEDLTMQSKAFYKTAQNLSYTEQKQMFEENRWLFSQASMVLRKMLSKVDDNSGRVIACPSTDIYCSKMLYIFMKDIF